MRKSSELTFKRPEVCREAASVCSVAKTAGTEGGIPQNTQNGLRPTQNTQKIFRKHGVRTSVYSVCRRRRLQCVQW